MSAKARVCRSPGWRLGMIWGLSLAAIAVRTDVAAAGADIDVRGLVDIVVHGNDTSVYLNRSMYQTTNFDNLHARLFLEGGSERTRAYLQFLVSDIGSSSFRFYGGYVQHQLVEGRRMYLEAGKIPVHEGTWAPRTYSDKNPLVGVPLAYYYRSTLPFRQVPLDLEQLLAQRGRGQSGVNYTNPDGSPRGTPWAPLQILYDNCWDYGAYFLGATARYDCALGLTTGAPGAPVAGSDTNGRPSLHARLGFAPVPGLKLHLSFARGPYLWDEVQPYLPADKRARDYAQTLFGGSAEWSWRHLRLNAELFHNRFDTPIHAGGLASVSGYLESVYTVLPGFYAAARYDAMRYAKVTAAAGPVTWDRNIQRVEAGVGYHLTHELIAKAVAQVYEYGGGWEWKSMLPAVQMSFRF